MSLTTTAEVRGIGLRGNEQVFVRRDSTDDPLAVVPDDVLENALVVSTRGWPDEIETHVADAGLDQERVTVVPVTGSRVRYDGPLDVRGRVGPNDLTGLGVRITEFIEAAPEGFLLFVDNINLFLMYADHDRVYRFFDSILGRTRTAGGQGLYLSVADAIADETEERFHQLCDRVVDAHQRPA